MVTLWQQLEVKIERLAYLWQVSQSLHEAETQDELMQVILDKAIQVTTAEGGAIWKVDPDEDQVVCLMATGAGSDYWVGARLPVGMGIAGMVVETHRPVMVVDNVENRQIKERYREEHAEGIYSLICAPIIISTSCTGAVTVTNKVAVKNFNDEDLNLLMGLASNAAAAMNTLQMRERESRAIERQMLLEHINRAFHSSIDLDELLPIIFGEVIEAVQGESGSVWLVDKELDKLVCKLATGPVGEGLIGAKLDMGEGIAGWVAANQQAQIIKDVREDKRWADRFDEETQFTTLSLMSVPLVVKGESLGTLNMVNKITGEPFSEDDLKLLRNLANNASLAIKNAQLVDDLKEAERVKRDMEIASRIQMSLLPRNPPQVPGVTLAGRCEPAKNVGGDYYDFFTTVDGNLGILIADVAGHSVGSALVMTITRSVLRFESLRQSSTSAVLEETNRATYDDLSNAELFITVFYANYDSKTGVLSWANGGHNLPFVYRPSTDEIITLGADGMIIGILPEVEYEERSMQLMPGDIMVLYTDGITEAKSLKGEMFEEKRLYDLVRKNHGMTSKELIDCIYDTVYTYSRGVTQYDDITAIVMKME